MSMKHLIEISKIVTKKKVKKIEIFDEATLKIKSSKFNEFYEALMAGSFKSDRDAAMQLYQCEPTDDKYRQLKSRFRKRLLNTLFFLDINTPGTSNYNRAYYTVNKEWTLVKILQSYGAYESASDLASQILTISFKFKFADVIVNCARILRDQAMTEGDERAFEEHDQYCKQFGNVLEAEIRSEELYQRVVMNYYLPEQKAQDLKEKIDIYCDALVGLTETFDSPVIFYNMYMVWIYRWEMLNDYSAMLEVALQAETYFEENPNYYRDDKMSEILLKQMSAYLHLKDFENGKAKAEKSLAKFDEGSDEWFKFMEYYLLLAMHTSNYLNAVAILNEVIGSPKYKKLSPFERDRWSMYEIFLFWVIETQHAKNPAFSGLQPKTFKSQRFMVETISYAKEQRIFTVFMLIGQVLFHLDKKSYVAAEERIERLKLYANRQLKPEENFRMIQFVKLLSQLAKVNFHISEITLEAKYYDRIIETPFKFKGHLHQIEAIPLEVLWRMISKRLGGK